MDSTPTSTWFYGAEGLNYLLKDISKQQNRSSLCFCICNIATDQPVVALVQYMMGPL